MKRSILFVGAVLFSGFSGVMMVQAEPRMPADRCELPAIMPTCPAGQASKQLPPHQGTCRYLCEQVAQPTVDENADLPMIELSGGSTNVILRCPFMIIGRTERLKKSMLDGYYCISNSSDDLGRANLLGYVKPGQNAVLSAVVKKNNLQTGVMEEETVTLALGEPFSVGDDNQAVIRYSGPVEVVVGTPSRHRHHRRHRAK